MKLFNFLLLIVIITFFVIYINYYNFKKQNFGDNNSTIIIEKGETFRDLVDKISGIDAFNLKIYLKYNKPDFNLQVGKYILYKDLQISEIIDSFRKPINQIDVKLTFLEGWNIYDIDYYLEKKLFISKGDFIKKTEIIEKALFEKYPFLSNAITLEGFLYPDTYNINPNNFSLDSLIKKMLNNFQKKVINEIMLYSSSKEILEIIILSSIVEKEEKNNENKKIVAGILKKRLEEGWIIGADITVCYPYKLTSEECKMVVSKYINKKNEYNTRTMTGLPKTPIGNPSFETIKSTIYSEKTSYYFYLHDKKGLIHYAINNFEHEQNKNKFLR